MPKVVHNTYNMGTWDLPDILYMENIHGGKLLCFDWKIAIRSKTFAVSFLQTYIADRKGHNSQENNRS